MKRIISSAFIALALVVTGCGTPFHLRDSSKAYQVEDHAIHLVGIDPKSDFGIVMVESLLDAGLQLKDSAKVSLVISNYLENRTVSAYSSQRAVSEFHHTLDLNVQILGTSAEPKIYPVHVERSQVYDSTYVLGSAEEENAIRQNLRTEAVRLVMLRLEALTSK